MKKPIIIWITGKRKAGKTTLAKELVGKMPNSVHLDGDEMRASISADLGFSEEDRLENNKRIAKLAKVIEGQGYDVVVSTICPPYVRKEVFWITGCRFIHI